MRCLKCGYVMEPFDTECLRCVRSQGGVGREAGSMPDPPSALPPSDPAHKDDIRCPYCHELVPAKDIRRHQNDHEDLRSDGQQNEYVTLPPEERLPGSLDGVPRIYYHHRCGSHTGMPEEIIRSYLQNPYLYFADQSFCGGCHKHIPCRELVWVETGENMQAYNDRLRVAYQGKRPPWYVWQFKRILSSLSQASDPF